MKKKIAKKPAQRKNKIRKRPDKRLLPDDPGPMLNPGNIHYVLAERNRGTIYGGIGTIQLLVKQLGLEEAINNRLGIFKLHNPYFESDHVLNIAYNILCNGECLEDIERLRNDEVYLDAAGTERIPDPTTAGDFCRRFSAAHIEILQDVINKIRLTVWRQQEPEFFTEAVIDADGTIAETAGQCKEGMDISYNIKEQIVKERGYKNIRLCSEQTAEFEYRPVKCHKSCRVVVLRKNLSVEKGENVLFDDIRYFFYITNDRKASRADMVGEANNRCNQENLIEQLKNGVNAMRMPVDNLVSNRAYMVMASLAVVRFAASCQGPVA